jgi:cytochrome c551/c552
MKPRLHIIALACIFFSTQLSSQEGEKVFKQNCGVCHTVGKGKLVGPDLKDVHKKYKEDWLTQWIKSSQALVKKGDATAVKLFEENNKLVMPDQSISDADIKSVLGFIKDKSEAPVEPASTEQPKVTTSTDIKTEPYDYKSKESSPISWKAATFVLAGFCIVLVIVVIALANTVGGMAKTFYSSKTDSDQSSEIKSA